MLRVEVEDIIRDHAPECIPLFADHWGRWPDERGAFELTQKLEERAQTMASFHCCDVAERLRQAITEIEGRAKG